MDERFYDSLELNKILEMLSKECSNEKTKKMALGIKPCSDLYTVKKETGKTAEALELSVRYGTPNFYNINDVSTYIKRAEAGGVLSLGELIQIRRLLAQTYELHHWYEQCENKDTSLSYLFEMLYPNKYLQQRLETAIIDETKLSDDASAELRSIRQKITRSGLKIRETLDKMIKSPSTQKYLQESIVTMRDGRFVLPVKTEFKGNVSGLVHDTSATGSTLFIEPMSVVEANNDIRILQNMKEIEEPFEKNQIGSSAMAYKRNPMRCERIGSLARYVVALPLNSAITSSTQWFERTLDDSANRRIVNAQAFLSVDAILNIYMNVAENLVVYDKVIEKHIKAELPFMATENIMMECVKAGGNRQELHERIRVLSMEAGKNVKIEGGENNLIELILKDEMFRPVWDRMDEILDAKKFIGRAPSQTVEFIRDEIDPILSANAKLLGEKGDVRI